MGQIVRAFEQSLGSRRMSSTFSPKYKSLSQIWLTVHKEVRTNKRIRAVYDYLVDALPRAI